MAKILLIEKMQVKKKSTPRVTSYIHYIDQAS